MPDASINIPGRALAAPRFGDANGTPVANVRVAAGRSRKNDQGGYDTLSETFYDVAYWRNHHDLIAGLGISPGDTVIVTGTVGGTDVYEGKASVKVNGHGIQHFPKRDQSQGGGFQQAPQQSQNAQQWGSGTGGGDGWPPAAQPGQGQQQSWGETRQQGGYDQPPF
ncbi:single-stranded DNA-binding protein-like [Tenebrio molitor]|uniref:single-stranded DNA-binding protein-like n=1 Tax=Tenebrio molitor TaxID=7067 RepID=UPI0036247A87